MSPRVLIACTIVLLTGCERDSGAPSSQQNRDLQEAERMLEEAPNSLDEIDENALLESNAAIPAAPDELQRR